MLLDSRPVSRLPFGASRKAGAIAIALTIIVLIAVLFGSILSATVTGGGQARQPDLAHLIRMTSLQAGLTTILSLLAGIAVAWSLNRLRFPGRDQLASLFATAIVAPGLVVAFGLIAVWGRAGWIGDLFRILGLDWQETIFGLHGILAAHVILNGAFATRVLLTRLDAIAAAQLKTGQSLGLSPWQRFAVIDWPALSGALPGLASIIFLLAFTSFPIVLLLGGGPANQTLEVAIYAAVRLSFDLHGAVVLALVQLAVCTLIIAPALYFTPDISVAGTRSSHHWPEKGAGRLWAATLLALALAGFALPLLATLFSGLTPGIYALLVQKQFWLATATSLAIGICSATLTALIAVGLTLGRAALSNRFLHLAVGVPAYIYLIVPSVVLSLGFFLTVRNLGIPPVDAAPFVLISANALLALPFAVSVLSPALSAIDKRYVKVSRALDLNGWWRWCFVEWPLLRQELGLVMALGFCFSLGDLGIISLFGTSEFSTLPWLMYRAMGAYRTNDAASIAALLLVLTFAAFWLLPLLFGKRRHA